MRYLLFISFLIQGFVANAQSDSLSFLESRKISDNDLNSKREGFFITGFPSVSSDPVAGIGIGLKTNLYWNGNKDNQLFRYTPYMSKLGISASYFTSDARELRINYDVPYYKLSRWRLKMDFKAAQNPTKLFFAPMNLSPTTLTHQGTNHQKYKDFEEAIKRTRTGILGEASSVTDALSYRYKETEYKINLRGDYTAGTKGRWRLQFGYELQYLDYENFDHRKTEGIDSASGNAIDVENGITQISQAVDNGNIVGFNGGWLSKIQTSIVSDTRDLEPDPSSGHFFEVANEFSSSILGSNYTYDKLLIQYRKYVLLPFGNRTVFTSRVGAGQIFGNQAPFFEYMDLWSSEESVNVLGGRNSIRGYRTNRFIYSTTAFANLELRYRFLDFELMDQEFGYVIVPFFDLGLGTDLNNNIDVETIVSYGAGFRVVWNQSTVLSIDLGLSKEDALLYFGVGHAF